MRAYLASVAAQMWGDLTLSRDERSLRKAERARAACRRITQEMGA